MSKNWEHAAGILWPVLVDAAKQRKTLTYSDLAPLIATNPPSVSRSLRPILFHCLDNGLPPLTVLVIGKTSNIPGSGFTAWYTDDLDEAYVQVHEFNWDSVTNPFEGFGATDTLESLASRISQAVLQRRRAIGEMDMKVVETIEELEKNLLLFEKYFSGDSDKEQKFVHDLIKKGRCFVCYKIKDEIRFAPSKYIGYSDTSMQKYKSNLRILDGRETNPAITKILNLQLIQDPEIEKQFFNFANNLGITPNNYSKPRKYWPYQYFDDNTNSEEGFPEGKIVERSHKNRERKSKLINTAKKNILLSMAILLVWFVNLILVKFMVTEAKGSLRHIILFQSAN